jgi:hypothetical protein
MIEKALGFLKDELNAYLKAKLSYTTDAVELTALVKQSGEVDITDNTVGMMLVNVEEERLFRSQSPQAVNVGGAFMMSNPDLKLNLFIIFAAYHSNHVEALKLLSQTVLFFQGRNAFNSQDYPSLGEEIEKLTVELYTINFEQQNQLWASLGAKYMPSVVYKVRMLIMNDGTSKGMTSEIGQMDRSFSGIH